MEGTADDTTTARVMSALELLLGVAIVLGHNVFKVLPNEVPILFVLGLASTRLRNGGLAAIGFRRPASWNGIVAIALAAAALRLLLGAIVIDPLTAYFWPPATAPEGINEIAGSPVEALQWLVLVWTSAASGEEVGYGGYLMTRAADIGRQSRGAWWVALTVSAVFFGFGHYYKGPAGILDSGVAGMILGGAHLFSGRVLWTAILAHGSIDTFGVMASYFGRVA